MRREPVEVLGAVVDAVEPPQEADAVLQAVAPVDEEVAEDDYLERLHPPWLSGDGGAEAGGQGGLDRPAKADEHPQHRAAPEQVLAEEKAEVEEPPRAEEPLARPGGERALERPED